MKALPNTAFISVIGIEAKMRVNTVVNIVKEERKMLPRNSHNVTLVKVYLR